MRAAGGGLDRLLPDGTCEIVLSRGDPFRHEGRLQPRAMVVGQMPRFMEIEPTGAVDLVGIRFRPGGLFPFRDFKEFAGESPTAYFARRHPMSDAFTGA